MREQKTKAQLKEDNNYKIIPTPWAPPPPHTPIIYDKIQSTLSSWYKLDNLINVEV